MSLERPVVVVAEDDAEIRHLIWERLDAAGYTVCAARDGGDAMRLLQSPSHPQALVLDLNMPVMDGFDVLETMRRWHIAIPTMVLSARSASDDVKRALSLGAKDYLTKPFSEVQLLQRVARLMRRKQPLNTLID